MVALVKTRRIAAEVRCAAAAMRRSCWLLFVAKFA
jgi:hypothetical protein